MCNMELYLKQIKNHKMLEKCGFHPLFKLRKIFIDEGAEKAVKSGKSILSQVF